LIEYAASHVQHMQKALAQMNLQLHHVVTDITGVTGMKILREIVAGETDPDALAAHRDVRCKASVETIRDALTGHYRPEHVFALRQALELHDFYQAKLSDATDGARAPLRPWLAVRQRRLPRRAGRRGHGVQHEPQG
jgi:transposase